MSYDFSWGGFLTRAQPFTVWHLEFLQRMLLECECVLVIIGSTNKEGTKRNPFSGVLREEMVWEVIDDYFPNDKHRFYVCLLDDQTYENNNNNPDWGEYLCEHIEGWIGSSRFAFYSGEPKKKLEDWFGKRQGVTLRRLRSRLYVPEGGGSATSVRDALTRGDWYLLLQSCPRTVVLRYYELRDIWLRVLLNPQDDFSASETSG